MKHATTVSTLTVLLTVAGATAGWASGSATTTAEVVGLYQQIHERLAADSSEGVAEAAATIAEKVRPCECGAEEQTAYAALGTAAGAMTGSDLATLREQFKAVSRAMAELLAAAGSDGTQLYFCPMAKGYWIQDRSEKGPRNPYLGKAMLACGNRVEKLAG